MKWLIGILLASSLVPSPGCSSGHARDQRKSQDRTAEISAIDLRIAELLGGIQAKDIVTYNSSGWTSPSLTRRRVTQNGIIRATEWDVSLNPISRRFELSNPTVAYELTSDSASRLFQAILESDVRSLPPGDPPRMSDLSGHHYIGDINARFFLTGGRPGLEEFMHQFRLNRLDEYGEDQWAIYGHPAQALETYADALPAFSTASEVFDYQIRRLDQFCEVLHDLETDPPKQPVWWSQDDESE